MCNDEKSETSKIVIMLRHMHHYLLVLLQYLQYYPPPGATVRELSQISNKRLMVRTIKGRQKGKAKMKGQKMHSLLEPKKKKERTSPSHGRKLSHPWPL